MVTDGSREKVKGTKSAAQNIKNTYKKSKPEGKKTNKTAGDRGIQNGRILVFLRTSIIILLSITIFYSPFMKGLFFEEQQLIAEILALFTFFIFWIYKFAKKDKQFIRTPIDYASIIFTAVYMVSVIFAASTRSAVSEWVKYMSVFAILIMIKELSSDLKIKKLLMWVIVSSALGVCIIGLDGAAGSHIVSVLNRVLGFMQLKDVMFSSLVDANGRINSVFQYSNTLAAYLMVIFFISNALLVSSERRIVKAIAGALNFIVLITFILTQSRGAYIVFAVALTGYIILLPPKYKLKGFISYGIPLLPSLAIWVQVSRCIQGSDIKEKVWVYVLAATAFAIVLSYLARFVERIFERFNWKVYLYTGIAFILIASGATIVAFNVTSPLELAHSAVQADSVTAVKRYVSLSPGNTYVLKFSAEAVSELQKPYAYQVDVFSKTQKDILLNNEPVIKSTNGSTTKGPEIKELEFKVPSDSKVIGVNFINTFSGTSVRFDYAKIIEKDTGKTAKNLKLNYKFIPQSIISRIEDLKATSSGVIRETYVKDGFKIIKQHWLTGAGGGAWPILYNKYQSYFYGGYNIHNYFVQVWLETGIVGLIALILFIVAITFVFVLGRFASKGIDLPNKVTDTAIFVGIIALLAHSAMDFNLGMMAILILLWTLAALLNAGYKPECESNTGSQHGILKYLIKFKSFFSKKVLSFNPAVATVIALVFTLIPLFFTIALNQAKGGVKEYEAGHVESALSHYKTAKTLDPFTPQYKIDYANLLITKSGLTANDLEEADKVALVAEKEGKNDYNVMFSVGDYYLKRAMIDKGLNIIDTARRSIPLNPKAWEQEISAYYGVVRYYQGKNDSAAVNKTARNALQCVKEIDSDNSKSVNPLEYNENTKKMIDEIRKLIS